MNAINKANSSKKWKVLEANLLEDFDHIQLESELDIIPAIFKQSAPVNFREICKTFQDMDEEKRRMIKDIWTFIRIVLTSGATSATPERFFSMQRKIKTWLNSTIGQKKYNSLSVLNAHTDIVDTLDFFYKQLRILFRTRIA